MGGVYTKIQDISSLRPGDHIAIWDKSRWPITYQHHGLIWDAGESYAEIKVCHVWSPLNGFREAQADSYFRISTLEEFLDGRNPRNLRLIEYHTSGFREVLSRWGEVHMSKSDIPEVVLARCKFLLGLGKGEFRLFTQNCEHAAHWCMTGEQWCRQNLTKARGRVPFEKHIEKGEVQRLFQEIEKIKALSQSVVDRVLSLNNSRVYLRVDGNKFVTILPSGQVAALPESDPAAMAHRTVFRMECYTKGYNCIKVRMYDEASDRYMFSRSTFSCFRDLRMKRAVWVRGKSGLTWEYSSFGHLKSMNQHRRYVGLRDDGLLVDVSMRGQACRVEFVLCGPAPDMYQPPDINVVTRAYDHQGSVQRIESHSMRDYDNSRRYSSCRRTRAITEDDCGDLTTTVLMTP